MISEWFGLTVPSDDLGCLQDIHWSMAAFGYFPTYAWESLRSATLGSDGRSRFDPRFNFLGRLVINAELVAGSGSQAWECIASADLIEEATGSPPSVNLSFDTLKRSTGRLLTLIHHSDRLCLKNRRVVDALC